MTIATRVLVSGAALALLGRAAHADEISAPSWLISAGGGLTLQNTYDDEAMANTLDVGGVLGAIVDARFVRHRYAIYGELDGFPVGGIYGGRVGIIVGGHTGFSYSELVDSQHIGSSTNGNVTTETYRNTYNVYADTVAGVWGLDLSASAHDLAGDGAFTLEAGIGMLGESQLELQLTYDVAHGAAGVRIQTIVAQGSSASWCLRVSIETLFDFHADATPGLITMTLGGGPGYHPH